MKIPHSSQRRGKGTMEINMTPMIDMVFLLIVYFVWTSGDLQQESLLPSRISEQTGASAATTDATPPPEADFDPVIVRVAWQGNAPTWRVNGQSLAAFDELRDVFAKLARIKRDAPVILHPDDNVPLGSIIDVYDLARVIGFDKIQFATAARAQQRP